MKRNYEIEFWRFAFTIFICLYHFRNACYGNTNLFAGGYIAVEFFFIVSGFLLISSYENKNSDFDKEKNKPLEYTIHRIFKLYPHYLFSFIVLFIFITIKSGNSFKDVIKRIMNSIWEILMFQMSGVQINMDDLVNAQTWYISVLIIIGYVIYFLLENYKKTFIQLIAPFSIILIYSFYSRNIGHLDVWGGFTMGISLGLLRGFAGMSIGCISYIIVKRLKECSFKKQIYNLFNAIQLLCFLFVVIFAIFKNHTQKDFILIIPLFVAITTSFINCGLINKILSNKILDMLGKISYPMFLNHMFIIHLFLNYTNNRSGYMFVVYIFITIIYSIFTYIFVNYILSKCRNIRTNVICKEEI